MWTRASAAGTCNGLLAGAVKQHQAGLLALIQQIVDPTIQELPQLGRQGGLLQLPHRLGGAPVQRTQLQILRQAPLQRFAWGLPTPEGFVAQLLKALLPQQGETVAVGAGTSGDPTGCAAAAFDRRAHQGRFNGHSTGFPGSEAGFTATQGLQLPATAAAIEALTEQKAQGCLGIAEGHQGIRCQGRAGGQAVQQTLRGLQQQGALQQRQQILKAGFLQQGQLPTPQRQHLEAVGWWHGDGLNGPSSMLWAFGLRGEPAPEACAHWHCRRDSVSAHAPAGLRRSRG